VSPGVDLLLILFLFVADLGTDREYKLTEVSGALFDDLYTRSTWEGEEQPDCMRDLISFIDYYGTKVVGIREVDRYYRDNRDKSILDRLTISDVAYAVLMYENTVGMWKHDEEVRRQGGGTVGRDGSGGRGGRAPPEGEGVKQKYHVPQGTRLKTFRCGWLPEGETYFRELEKKLSVLWNNSDFFSRLKEDWGTYAIENGRCKYKKKGSLTGELDDMLGDDADDGDVFLLDDPVLGTENIVVEDPIEE